MLLNFRKALANFIYPEMETERRSLERAALVDEMTGLANRRAFDLARPVAEKDSTLCFIIFDGNNFGKVNKACGHSVGDDFIKSAARAIGDAAEDYRISERVFRIGGDEFAVIAPKRIAFALRENAELFFGVCVISEITVSLSGEIGETFKAADDKLQGRKGKQKLNYAN